MSNRATQWKKGQSGNLNGRPKEEWTMRGLIREAMEIEMQDGIPAKKVIAIKLLAMAMAGDIVAIKEVNQRLDGMPQQDITSDGEKLGAMIVYRPEKNKE